MRAKDAVGRYGEDVAARHLHDAGMVILDRNWTCRGGEVGGEIDIVARDGDVLVFCEVKTRRSLAFGSPAEAVTGRKLARLRALAAAWLHDRRPAYATEIRFDVVSVLRGPTGPAQVEHLRGVC